MKSVERHKLETNVLAHGLEVYIERYKPYLAKIGIGIVAIVALLFIWSFVSGSSSARRNEAWDSFNQAVGAQPMNVDQLRHTAEDFPGSKMQQMSDVTVADNLVWNASISFIYNRAAANDALNRAASAYQKVVASSDDKPLVARAHLGMARVFEMQGELDKARAQYELVTEPYASYAKLQVERLAMPGTAEAVAWLATAEPPRPVAPMGPGTPGQRPEFSPGDLSLPNGAAAPGAGTGSNKGAAGAFDELLKQMEKDSKSNEKDGDRYKTDQPPAKDEAAKDDAAKGGASPANPADEKKADK